MQARDFWRAWAPLFIKTWVISEVLFTKSVLNRSQRQNGCICMALAHLWELAFDPVLPVYLDSTIKHLTRTLQTQTADKMLSAVKVCRSVKADDYLHRSSFKTETITGDCGYLWIFHAAFRQNFASLINNLEVFFFFLLEEQKKALYLKRMSSKPHLTCTEGAAPP